MPPRVSWTAARLQTLDQGAPVSFYTVSRELGHGSEEMVKRVYAHLGTIRHRSEVVEFRVEQHLEALKDRLGVLRFGTTNDTTKQAETETETPTALRVIGVRISGVGPDSNARPLAPEGRPPADER